MKRRITFPLAVGVMLTASTNTSSATTTIVAAQDFSVKRGPSVEGGLHAKESSNNSTDRYVMLRFNSTSFGADVTSASFNITANSDTSVQFQGTYNYRVYAVPDLTINDELVAETGYSPGAGSIYDGSIDLVDATKLTLLGDINGVGAGDTVSLSNSNLLSFLQADTNDVATLVFTRLSLGANSTFLDRGTANPPRLIIETIPEPAVPSLAGLSIMLFLHRRRR